VDEVNTGTSLDAGGMGATAAGTAPGANTAVLQSILLQQQRCAQSVSAPHVHVDSQFQVMKALQQQQFATMIDSIRRFGGAIKGGLPIRTQCKLATEGGPSPNKAMPHLDLLLTVLMMAMRSCALTFTPHMIHGMSTSLVLVDASLPLSSLVKSAVDTVSTRRSSATVVGNAHGISWNASFVKGTLWIQLLPRSRLPMANDPPLPSL